MNDKVFGLTVHQRRLMRLVATTKDGYRAQRGRSASRDCVELKALRGRGYLRDNPEEDRQELWRLTEAGEALWRSLKERMDANSRLTATLNRYN